MPLALARFLDTIPTHLRATRTRRGPAGSTRPDIRFVDLGDTLVRLRQAGTRGPSVVFGTDPPVPLELYDGLIEALAPLCQLTVFEMPGFGCSLPRVGLRLSMDGATSAVTRLMEQLPGAPHVLGLPCVTGFIAIAMARARPDLVDRLLLLQTPTWEGAQAWLDCLDPKRRLRTPVLGQLALAALRRRRVRGWYATALADPSLIEPFSHATLENFEHGGCFCLASGFQDFLSDHAGRLGPVRQPALILWGGADPSHSGTDPADSRQWSPGARLRVLEGAGHFPELEATAEFARELERFLTLY